MKKILLAAAALATLSLSVNAQRMTLHEEFTGENCGPCAGTNPDFWTLLNGAGNPAKLIHIAYMEPIPTSGWYYMRTQTLSDARASYYSVPFAPYGRYDGHVPDPTAGTPPGSDGGHPYYFTQSDIDAEAAIPDSFTIAVTNAWTTNYDSVTVTVTITAGPSGWSGTTPYLRLALVETNDFATAPGTNGETHFEHVVQAMYPNALGTSIAATWAPGATQTYTISGPVPIFVDKSKSPFAVAWIQDDANKYIAQAGQASPLSDIPTDAGAVTTTGPNNLTCATGTYSLTHTASLVNSGTATLTTANIYYSIDGGAYTSYAWSGSLAASASTTVSMPAVSVTVGGSAYHTIVDSVGMPNGSPDINPANNVSGTSFFIENTNGMALPYSTSFESSDTSYYQDGAWGTWYSGSSTSLAHSGTYAMGFPFIEYAPGTVSSFVLPEVKITDPANTTLKFWVAYAQQSASSTDKLEVVYSTDCGSSWTSLWSLTGSTMVTLAASTTDLVVPTSPSQYKNYSVNLSGVTAGSAMLGFRGTDGGGNFIFVDDINIVATEGVTNVAGASENVSIYPNPAKDEATLSFTLTNESDVNIQVVDGLGRVMNVVADDKMMVSGSHIFTINTSSLATGIYNVVIHSDAGTTTERLSVIR